jgi:CxxC motif-containing protein
MLTATVVVESGILPRLPVISDGEIPKDKIAECLDVVYKTSVKAPVLCGDVVIKNICGTGTNILASRSMASIEINE